MADQRNKKTFMRRDANGKLIPGSARQQIKKPKFGDWFEIPKTYECCNTTTLSFTVVSATMTNVALRFFCNGTIVGSPLQTSVNTTTSAGVLTALNNAFSVIGTFAHNGLDFTLELSDEQKRALCSEGTLTMTIAAT